MRNHFNSLFLALLFILSAQSVVFASSQTDLNYENLSFDNLKEFKISLIGNEQGISTYSGLKNNLRLNYTVENQEVTKIIVLFDFDVGSAERTENVKETINIANNLMPNRIKSQTKAQEKLYNKLAKLKSDRDSDVFMLDRLRLECAMNNGMLNIRITK